jgi:hypothetical protein
MRNHSNDRKLCWLDANGRFVPVRFLVNWEIERLLTRFLVDDKYYGSLLGSEWRIILENEKAFRNQSIDRLFFTLLLKDNSLSEKRDILFLINPDLSVKETTVLAQKLILSQKKAIVAED